MKLWETLNSRLVSVIILLAGILLVSHIAFIAKMAWVANKFEQFSGEMNDPNTFTVVENTASGIAGAIKKGFTGGASSSSTGQKNPDIEFMRVKESIDVKILKKVPSRQDSLENYLYEISNNSDSYVKRMKINFEFYDDSGELIDAENDWINEIKVLAPGEKMSLKAKHWLHKPEGSEEYQGHSASAKAEVTSFSITEKPQE